ncbi:sulfurtransferase TusA family protein [Lutimaribacter sp. EGI FJ00015]|uniref:Sulfurtransferase TusA family protein n=1 Tax=Lutimaribacter degradans TaxID=2945989 RepID=A0ACC5ZSL2_9RHOB|nr:sulfurtransferase TusA family protein [Lutimaribacter sp. EGI FJ00013]MCM2561135.1 sulfurtransferase TusA family protein [Lutimaribacter sp. EGI FJ00013]MCO0611916.1 sulfurtransferase TusA family protein [Lutimaribacter sp. EGI FJ00015]MCO0634963.1 sulfurtransferase TusA family protein [Lutimaribacter sp. EGI FJ00014]
MTDKADITIDARGLICPLPVLRARKGLVGLAPGTLVAVLADDAMARIDLPHFCAEAGHLHLSLVEEAGHQRHLIRRGPD